MLRFSAPSIALAAQRRFYDFNAWSLKKRVKKLHSDAQESTKASIGAHPKECPWSSFSFYSKSKQALICIDPVR
jgi:hypothetical protein